MPNLNLEQRQWILSKYKMAFPHALRFVECTTAQRQKEGVDYYALFADSAPLFIEEKIRWEKYPDLLIEEYANWDKKTPGWGLDKNKKTHYLAYIIIPSKEIFIIDFPALQQFFIDNYNLLTHKYERVMGKTYDNFGHLLYQTSNIPVPWQEFDKLWKAKNVWHYSEEANSSPYKQLDLGI
jgi:hypothetical protein